jgi:hypothetical protein
MGGVQMDADHAGASDETGEAQMVVGRDPLASTADQIDDLILSRAETAAQRRAEPVNIIDDIVDEWGRQSFPASDPPSNW